MVSFQHYRISFQLISRPVGVTQRSKHKQFWQRQHLSHTAHFSFCFSIFWDTFIFLPKEKPLMSLIMLCPQLVEVDKSISGREKNWVKKFFKKESFGKERVLSGALHAPDSVYSHFNRLQPILTGGKLIAIFCSVIWWLFYTNFIRILCSALFSNLIRSWFTERETHRISVKLVCLVHQQNSVYKPWHFTHSSLYFVT